MPENFRIEKAEPGGDGTAYYNVILSATGEPINDVPLTKDEAESFIGPQLSG